MLPVLCYADSFAKANILISDTGRACLADFGLSCVLEVDTALWNSNQSSVLSGGTVRWQAPELIDPAHEDTRAGKASDIYAFACVCYEVCKNLRKPTPQHLDV